MAPDFFIFRSRNNSLSESHPVSEDRAELRDDCSCYRLASNLFAEPVPGVVEFALFTVYDEIVRISGMFKQWSVQFVVRRLWNFMVFINPRLTLEQQAFLLSLTSKAVDQLLWRRSSDPKLLRDIVAIACPNHNTGLLFGYLMEAIAGLADNSHREHQDFANSDPDEMAEEVAVQHTLSQNFCIEEAYVSAMPFQVRKAVLGALAGGEGLHVIQRADSGHVLNTPPHRTDSPSSIPMCCISLEPLLCPNGTITVDVVAVIPRHHNIDKDHAFLYRGRALFAWLGTSQIPTHPETRSLVRPTDMYRLS